MEKVLIKYKHAEDFSELGYEKAVYSDRPFEILRIAREADFITLNDTSYDFIYSEYKVPENEGSLDVLYIYIDEKC